MNLLLLYRYISLILTSFFYLVGHQPSLVFKAGVVAALGVAAWILTDLQRRYLEHTNIVKMIVLIETLGVTLLLIPTGGISSPFIWYALNPVLVAAILLTPRFSWMTLTFYLATATFIANRNDSIIVVLEDQSYFYLVCILITLLASLFSGLTKELLQVNGKLANTNEKYQETLEHIMSLYHMLENFSSHKSPKKLTDAMTMTLMKCLQKHTAFFWITDHAFQKSYISNETTNRNLEMDLTKDWDHLRKQKDAFTHTYHNEQYWMKVIRTTKYIGVIGVKVTSNTEIQNTFLLHRTFEFLVELSEMMLERIHMDHMMDQLTISEEQNRIANEMHDSVSQRLFGIVYSLHSLRVKSRNITTNELEQEFEFLSQTANTTMKELRASIYRLSTVKKGEEPFLVLIENYLVEYAKLNDIRIAYDITGNESSISANTKNGLYRIICEACGNAVRHGRCTLIEVTLALEEERTYLVIKDNGIGIQTKTRSMKEQGIGLSNMQNIVHSLGGTFEIGTPYKMGTTIQIDIPHIKSHKKQEVFG
ncbi:ATP-binding protein [Psychrobacillus sp. FSL K6-2836]|uniref:sensor histidine kinase n=1 Tax=Psychrobacillus sp. FSL K6-2836 TaxID=2921548 RepID=UPI0030F86A48